eukprot:TRINITY_DN850_c0_g1_i1.p1 TRINITY_DN850_c0_g1~~TRINITY_DN850_c0_g1_i1.p1  ORF type:complete len:247 (-),score=68.50 TRINITY_DN850_c0_g1_i1:36-776(-)
MIRFGFSEVVKRVAVGIESLALKILDSEDKVVPVHRHRVLVPLQQILPETSRDTFVAPNSSLIGRVKLGEESIVGWGTVIRGDHVDVQIGKRTNIGDMVTITPLPDFKLNFQPITIGDDVSIGSGVVLSGCTIGDGCVIDIGSKLSTNVKMEAFSALGPGSVVEPGQTIPSGQYWAGNPAKFVHQLSEEERDSLPAASQYYRSVFQEIVRTIAIIDEPNTYPDKIRTEELWASSDEEREAVEKMNN